MQNIETENTRFWLKYMYIDNPAKHLIYSDLINHISCLDISQSYQAHTIKVCINESGCKKLSVSAELGSSHQDVSGYYSLGRCRQ